MSVAAEEPIADFAHNRLKPAQPYGAAHQDRYLTGFEVAIDQPLQRAGIEP